MIPQSRWMASLVLAVRFLTILPVPGREIGRPGALGRAAWWFPAVGLALGGGLMLANFFPKDRNHAGDWREAKA